MQQLTIVVCAGFYTQFVAGEIHYSFLKKQVMKFIPPFLVCLVLSSFVEKPLWSIFFHEVLRTQAHDMTFWIVGFSLLSNCLFIMLVVTTSSLGLFGLQNKAHFSALVACGILAAFGFYFHSYLLILLMPILFDLVSGAVQVHTIEKLDRKSMV